MNQNKWATSKTTLAIDNSLPLQLNHNHHRTHSILQIRERTIPLSSRACIVFWLSNNAIMRNHLFHAWIMLNKGENDFICLGLCEEWHRTFFYFAILLYNTISAFTVLFVTACTELFAREKWHFLIWPVLTRNGEEEKRMAWNEVSSRINNNYAFASDF